MGQRSSRLLIPLVFGMAVIVPPQSYLEVEKLRYAGSFAEFYRLYITGFHGFCRGGDCLIMPTWNHLWFVAYLWIYTALLYAAVRMAPPVLPWLRRLAGKHLAGAGVLLWPIAYLAVIRLELAPRFPATHALTGDWYNHAMYFGVFLLGFALAGAHAAWNSLERARWWTLGLAHRHLRHDSAVRRYLTAAIFPVYILHQTVIVVVAHALKPSHLYPPVEGALLVLVTAGTCFLSYEIIRRVRLLRPLFGLEAGVPRAPEVKASLSAALPAAPRFGVPQDIN
jgi:hypothetical protein